MGQDTCLLKRKQNTEHLELRIIHRSRSLKGKGGKIIKPLKCFEVVHTHT